MMFWNKVVVPLLLVVALSVAALAGAEAVTLLAQQPPDLPATQPALPASTSNKSALVGRLANGVSVEVIGINESPSAGKQWWLVNGDPVDTAPYTRANFPHITPSNGCVVREVVFKINKVVNGSPDPASVSTLMPTRGSYGGGPRGDFKATLCELYDEQPGGMTMRAKVAAGPWKTVCTDNETTQYGESGLDFTYFFSAPFTVNGRIHIVVGCTGSSSSEDHRLLAIDTAGRQVVADGVGGAGSSSGSIGEYAVKLPRAVDQSMAISGPALRSVDRDSQHLPPSRPENRRENRDERRPTKSIKAAPDVHPVLRGIAIGRIRAGVTSTPPSRPCSSSSFLSFSASAFGRASLTVLGAPSTRSLASLRPRLVAVRTTLITLIFFSPGRLEDDVERRLFLDGRRRRRAARRRSGHHHRRRRRRVRCHRLP